MVRELEREIGQLKSTVERHEKIIFNGDKGLINAVPRLTETVEHLDETVSDLRTVVSGLCKFQDEMVGERRKSKNFGYWLTILIAALAFIFTVYTNSRMNTYQEFNDWRMDQKADRPKGTKQRSGTVDLNTYLDSIK